MRNAFDDGTLLLEDAPDTVPYAEWDDRVDEYRVRAPHYRNLRAWAGKTDRQQPWTRRRHQSKRLKILRGRTANCT